MRARTLPLVAAALCACVRRAPPPDLSLDPARLLAQVRVAAAGVASVRGQARVRVKGEGRGSIPAFVAAQRPGRLHVEALDFFGNPVAVLVTDGGRLALYDGRDRTWYRGGATPRNVARLVPLALAPEELVAVLCGAPPLAGEPVRAEPGRGEVTLEVKDGTRTTTLRVVSGAAVARASVRDGDTGYDVVYGERRDLAAGLLPDDLRLSSERPPVSLDLAWIDAEVNAPLEAALFRMEPPAGARVVEIEDRETPLPPPLFPDAPTSQDAGGRTPAPPGGDGPR